MRNRNMHKAFSIDEPATSRPRNLLLAWQVNDQSKRQETIWLKIVTANQIDLTSKWVWMGVPKIADHQTFCPLISNQQSHFSKKSVYFRIYWLNQTCQLSPINRESPYYTVVGYTCDRIVFYLRVVFFNKSN